MAENSCRGTEVTLPSSTLGLNHVHPCHLGHCPGLGSETGKGKGCTGNIRLWVMRKGRRQRNPLQRE